MCCAQHTAGQHSDQKEAQHRTARHGTAQHEAGWVAAAARLTGGGGVAGLSLDTDAVDLLVHLRAVVETHGTRAGHGPGHTGRVPRTDARHLAGEGRQASRQGGRVSREAVSSERHSQR